MPDGELVVSQFVSSAQECFDEIAHAHGMHRIETPGVSSVCYENSKSRLCVAFESPRSREVVVAISRLPRLRGIAGIPFDLREIIRSQYSLDAASINGKHADSTSALNDNLNELASLTKKWMVPLLGGDQEKFEFLERFRARESNEAPILEIIREKIVTAWWQEDYKTVVKLSKALGPRLTCRELERWTCAEEKLK